MDVAGVFLQLIQCMSPSIVRRWRDHRDVYKNMEILRKRLGELNCQKTDIELKLATELIEGETELRAEVKNWLESAVKIGGEVDGIEEKVRKAKLFRAGPGKLVILKIAELDDWNKKGAFPDGLVIHLPKPCGYEMPTTSTLGGETTFKRKMEEIWGCLLDDEVTKVGVYGMGGIGKTTALEHIHNRLLKDRKEDFKSVIWVTVSKESNIMNLQDKIAMKLELDLSKDNEVKSRAHKLYTELKKKIPYALILDDLWEVYALKEVGIPEPSRENGCKLVVTTRSQEVCYGMSCKPIEMEILSEGETLKLFVDQVGGSVMSDPKLAEIIKKVVRECAGLPLATVTIAGSLKGKFDINEWEIALEDLRESISSDIYERLKFSYDRLSDKKLQECLLYCALYPEDYLIEREMLIEHLMAEGIIEERKTRQSRIRKGQVMLNNLVYVCLLNDACDDEGKKCVKMHDLVRDMALKITSGSPRYMVKAGVGLRSMPGQENWDDDLEKVSLLGNSLSSSSEVEPTKCSRLSTLLLQRNYLWSISTSFFLHMRVLNVLDLSYNFIECLPESVSDLTNLTALFLRKCDCLRSVPSLAKLVNLRLLDLHGSRVEEIPNGLNMLTKLRYLNLRQSSITTIPEGILCNLIDLQYLAFGSDRTQIRIRVEEIENLRMLENFFGVIQEVDCFNALVRSFESRELTAYHLLLGDGHLGDSDHQENKAVVLSGLIIQERSAAMKLPLSLPKDVEMFYAASCILNVESLCEIAAFKNVTKLRRCTVNQCQEIKHAFSYSSGIFPLLQSLEELNLRLLPDFRGLICRDRGTSSPLPHDAFSSLKLLTVTSCKILKKLIITSLLPNLEELSVKSCDSLVEISIGAGTSSDNNDKGEEGPSSTDMITLPKIKKLTLTRLAQLQSLPLIADSVQSVRIWGCPKLRRIPIVDREVWPSSLESVRIDKASWDLLKWDHPNAKEAVHSMNKSTR